MARADRRADRRRPRRRPREHLVRRRPARRQLAHRDRRGDLDPGQRGDPLRRRPADRRRRSASPSATGACSKAAWSRTAPSSAWARSSCSTHASGPAPWSRPAAWCSERQELGAGHARGRRAGAREEAAVRIRAATGRETAADEYQKLRRRYLTTRLTRSTTVEAAMLIGGEWRQAASSEEIEVVNPATEEVVGAVPSGAAADVDAGRRDGEASLPGVGGDRHREARAHPRRGRGADRGAREGAGGAC